jgi:hypothetical protein
MQRIPEKKITTCMQQGDQRYNKNVYIMKATCVTNNQSHCSISLESLQQSTREFSMCYTNLCTI